VKGRPNGQVKEMVSKKGEEVNTDKRGTERKRRMAKDKEISKKKHAGGGIHYKWDEKKPLNWNQEESNKKTCKHNENTARKGVGVGPEKSGTRVVKENGKGQTHGKRRAQ